MLRKQEFYEGAALHLLAQSDHVTCIRHQAPFFVFNDHTLVLLKYSTRGRSPWGFTFSSTEQETLAVKSGEIRTVIGMICGSDGVAAVPYEEFLGIASPREGSVHIACYRAHGELYEVNGPDGRLPRKVSPLNWQRLLHP